jgi:hypothetical protein
MHKGSGDVHVVLHALPQFEGAGGCTGMASDTSSVSFAIRFTSCFGAVITTFVCHLEVDRTRQRGSMISDSADHMSCKKCEESKDENRYERN